MTEPTRVPARVICHFTARIWGVADEDIRAPRNGRKNKIALSRARWAAVSIIREVRPDLTFPVIGRIVGYADMKSIWHARQMVRLLSLDPTFAQKLSAVRELVAQWKPGDQIREPDNSSREIAA